MTAGSRLTNRLLNRVARMGAWLQGLSLRKLSVHAVGYVRDRLCYAWMNAGLRSVGEVAVVYDG
jgi:hypothetical protein